MPAVVTAVCAVLVVGLLVGEKRDHSLIKAASKVPASLAFIAVALLNGALVKGSFGALVLLGLVLGAVGDVALLSREKKPFLVGIVAFLLSHVAYVGAFIAHGATWWGGVAALVVLVPVAVGIRRWIGDRAGALGGAVTAYVVVITAMVACSAAALTRQLSTQRMVLVVAAVLFFVSDICVARDRFVAPGFANRRLGLPLYYSAQLLFAWSLVL